MKGKISVIAVAAFILCAVMSLGAHHSPSAVFDMTRRVVVSGTLTGVDWINPHIVLSIDVPGDGGKADHWTLQSNPPSWYRSVGLARADFARAIGQTITVECLKARDGSSYGYMQKITLPDGRSLELVSNAEPK